MMIGLIGIIFTGYTRETLCYRDLSHQITTCKMSNKKFTLLHYIVIHELSIQYVQTVISKLWFNKIFGVMNG